MVTLKSIVAKGMAAGLLAGVFMVGGTKKAEAQVSIGVQFGGPAVYQAYPAYPAYPVYQSGYYDGGGYYGGGGYYDRGRWEHERREQWERQQEWRRHDDHERWEHGRGGYGDGRGYGYRR